MNNGVFLIKTFRKITIPGNMLILLCFPIPHMKKFWVKSKNYAWILKCVSAEKGNLWFRNGAGTTLVGTRVRYTALCKWELEGCHLSHQSRGEDGTGTLHRHIASPSMKSKSHSWSEVDLEYYIYQISG